MSTKKNKKKDDLQIGTIKEIKMDNFCSNSENEERSFDSKCENQDLVYRENMNSTYNQFTKVYQNFINLEKRLDLPKENENSEYEYIFLNNSYRKNLQTLFELKREYLFSNIEKNENPFEIYENSLKSAKLESKDLKNGDNFGSLREFKEQTERKLEDNLKLGFSHFFN